MHYKIVALYRNGIEHKSIYMYIGSYMNSYGLTCGFMFSSFVINKKTQIVNLITSVFVIFHDNCHSLRFVRKSTHQRCWTPVMKLSKSFID